MSNSPRAQQQLADVASLVSGPAFKSAQFGEEGEGIRLLRGDNIEPANLRWNRTRTWPDRLLAGYENLLLQSGDIILAMDRPIVSAGLKLARVTERDLPALLVQRVARIRAVDIDGRYLYLALQAPAFAAHLRRSFVGTQLPHISLKQIGSYVLRSPPLNEQRRIVDILEGHLSRLDAGRASLQSAKQRASALRFRHLATLAPDDAPRIALGNLATNSGYGTSTKCVAGGVGVPVVRIPNLQSGRVNLSPEKRVADPNVDLAQLMLKQDDLLVVRTNGSRDLIGRSAVVQSGVTASFASYLIRFQLDKAAVRPEWARTMLNTPQIRANLENLASSSAGQYNLGLSKLNSLSMPCPSLDLQDSLLKQHEEQEWQHETLTNQLNAADTRAQVLKQALLVAAFTGRLTGQSSDAEVVEEIVSV